MAQEAKEHSLTCQSYHNIYIYPYYVLRNASARVFPPDGTQLQLRVKNYYPANRYFLLELNFCLKTTKAIHTAV